MNIAERLYAQARIYPVKRENKVQTVTKLESGDLLVRLVSGRTYTVAKEDELFQLFVVWVMVNDQATEVG